MHRSALMSDCSEFLLTAACVRARSWVAALRYIIRDVVRHANGRLRLAQQEAVGEFHTLHERVVGVGDFILPHAERPRL